MTSKKFIKMDINMLKGSKFRLIKCCERWYIVATVWMSLLFEAGAKNDKGLIYLSKNKSFSIEMLSRIFDLPVEDIKYSLDILQEYDMISIHENGIIEIVNWCEYQEPKSKTVKRTDKSQESLDNNQKVEPSNETIEDTTVPEADKNINTNNTLVSDSNTQVQSDSIIEESKKDDAKAIESENTDSTDGESEIENEDMAVLDSTNTSEKTIKFEFDQDSNEIEDNDDDDSDLDPGIRYMKRRGLPIEPNTDYIDRDEDDDGYEIEKYTGIRDGEYSPPGKVIQSFTF